MSPDNNEVRELRVNEAIVLYEIQREEGHANALEQALLEYADCEPELRAYAASADRVEQLCGPLRLALVRPSAPVIDGYEDLSEIGRGGMSVVYLARQQHSKRMVAIKLVREDIFQYEEPESRERFIDQMRMEAKATLDHANIVRLYHAGKSGDKVFLVMEYVEGGNLGERIHSQSLGLYQLVEVMTQTAGALAHAHRNGILHSDIKPSNILVDDKVGIAKLADFGLAVSKSSDTSSADEYYMTGGTSGYLAPELASSPERVPTYASDVYAFGATLFESLTGTLPASVNGESSTEPIRSPKSINPSVPNALDRLCNRCLNPDPKERVSSMEEVRSNLEELLTDSNAAQLFVRMGWLLFGFGVIVGLMHTGVAFSIAVRLGEAMIWLLFFSPYIVLFTVFCVTELPARFGSARAQRELWTIWTGHLGAAVLVVCFSRFRCDSALDAMVTVYPLYGVITALCAWVMGASFWRGHFVLAALWCLAALLMFSWPVAAPFIFGMTGLVASLVIGSYELHLQAERSLDRALVYSQDRQPRQRQHALLSASWTMPESRSVAE